jgi:hypothetical protein
MTFGIDEDGRSDIPLLWAPRGAGLVAPSLEERNPVSNRHEWYGAKLAGARILPVS